MAYTADDGATLVYLSDESPGLRRRRAGKGFAYRDAEDRAVRDVATLKRVRSLAIPPAWTDVWIAPDPAAHIQATGRDARGRKQYRYHPAWRAAQDQTKFEHMLTFGRLLPEVRRQVDEDMARRGLPREKVMATIVKLLQSTLIRIGNEDYVKQNKSFGLSTLRRRHVVVDGGELRFRFKGKSGKVWRLAVRDRRVARVVKSCQELPGQNLFQYLDEEGEQRAVTSADVNEYLRRISGEDITAKDFRTWAGTVLAAMALQEFSAFDSKAAGKRNLRAAIENVATRLGNTPTICRKCYIHPEIIDGYLEGSLLEQIGAEVEADLRDDLSGLEPEEVAVLAFLRRRIGDDLERRRRPVDGPGTALQPRG